MKRRALLSALFGIGAVFTLADPAQARRRRGFRRGVRRSGGYRLASSRRSYRPVSYSGERTVRSRVLGDIPASRVGQAPARASAPPVASAPPSRNRPAPINRNLPEFWRSPGEIDRPIVAEMRTKDIKGKTRAEIIKKYGPPRLDEGSQLTWNVGRTSDGIIAPQTVTINLSGGKGSSFRRGF